MNINQNAVTVLERRYLTRNESGEVTETVEGLFHRVAAAIAKADENYGAENVKQVEDTFYNMMTNLEFLPNSPTLMNAGRPLGQLSACFVLPVADSMEDIFEAIKQAALIHKSGGGTGFSFSRLRPSGSTVNSTGGVASGPISFMRVFNMATEAVKQGGTRRGANMGILRVDHPDILSFIDCKKDNADITNFNISVGITEEFMTAAVADKEYDLVDPSNGAVTGRLNAKEVYDKIVEGAWHNGEPGIIFLDRLNRDNIVPGQGPIESTNPCGEQPLLPFESCNLGSINLVKMLKKEGHGYAVDWDKLETTVRDAVHFLDNVIDVNKYPLEQIDETTKATRKIGLGVMGFSDMLLYRGISYNSDKGVQAARKIMAFINKIGHAASCDLAKTRGAFPLFEESILKDEAPRRNGTVTTIAPTGTLSIIGGCSSGVEPVFAFVFIRNVMDGDELIEVNPVLKEVLQARGLYSDELMRKISEAGTIAHIEEIPQDIRDVFVCAHDVTPEYHIKMQAAFQEFTDNAVSKTVNFNHDATIEDVSQVYMLAYQKGCKGVTIYRDGSRDNQVLNIKEVSGKAAAKGKAAADSGETAAENAADLPELPTREIGPRPRPSVVTGFTERMKIGCGNLYITVNYDDQGIVEVFTNTGKAGGCPSQSEATARLVSISLRSGISADEIIDQLKGIRCPSTIRQRGMSCTSCPDAIAKIVRKVDDYIKSGQAGGPGIAPSAEPAPQTIPGPGVQRGEDGSAQPSHALRHCPDCGGDLEHEGGCVICRGCGYSKCG